MHIWFLNQFYPPDRAPTGTMLEAVVERMSGDGHECVVWCSGGSYGTVSAEDPMSRSLNTTCNVAQVRRIGALGAGRSFIGKLRGWLGFYLRLSLRLLMARDRPDVIVAMTTPPFLSVLARVAAWRHRARHAHWVMDLYPDVLAAHGMLDERSMPYRMLARVARWGFGGKRAGAVLTLGPCMAERMERRIGRSAPDLPADPPTHGAKIPLWVPLWASTQSMDEGAKVEAAGRQLRLERGWGTDEVVIMYSGNLGRGHVVQPMLDAALELSLAGRQRLRWVFCAHGARLEEVKRFATAYPEVGVEFLDPVPTEQLPAHLASADLHLASLEASWSGCMVPSKIQGSFAAGRAVLFVGPLSSSPARWIGESEAGWAVDVPSAGKRLPEILSAPGLKDEARRRGIAAKSYAARHFDRDANAGEVARILLESARRDG